MVTAIVLIKAETSRIPDLAEQIVDMDGVSEVFSRRMEAAIKTNGWHRARARTSKAGYHACCLCAKPILAGHVYLAPKKGSSKRSHVECFKNGVLGVAANA